MRQRKVKNEEEKIARYGEWIVDDPARRKGRWAGAFPPVEISQGTSQETSRPALQEASRLASRRLYLEIGCGKGKFITDLARRHPQNGYIAVEGAGTVVLRALEKAAGVRATAIGEGSDDGDLIIGEPLRNIRFLTDYVQTLGDIFAPGEIQGIYLNFSDPWPKERHAKRRLTHRKYLTEYRKILSPGSTLEFKTDNDELFAFSVQEFYDFGLEILELTDDLHGVGDNLHGVGSGLLCPTRILDGDGCEVSVPGPGEGAAASAEVTTEYEDRFTAVGKNVHYCKVRF